MTTTPFRSGQIVRIACADDVLYAEVIQVSETRCLCWVRPVVLRIGYRPAVERPVDTSHEPEDLMIDLRGGSDLLIPPSVLQFAGDVEFLSALTQIDGEMKLNGEGRSAKDYLSKFLQRLFCTAY